MSLLNKRMDKNERSLFVIKLLKYFQQESI